ncbi:16673_t:CDS:2 [Rhizophagus irregularis]|nr:16673_t:CDS:2 [Rhizophagus irregularis]
MSTPVHSIQEVDALGTKRRYHNKQSLCYIIRSGVAGGVAGCVAKTVIAPLDRVKILFQASNPHFQKYAGTWSGAFQASKEIYTINGVRGLFQGNSATLLRILPYAAIKFVAFEQIRHLIRVRLAFEVRNDSRVRYVTLFKQIYHESAASHRKLIHFPIMNFYRGLNPTIIGMIPYAGVSFFTHYLLTEFCRTELADSTTKPSLAAGKLDSRGQNIKSPLKTWAELTVGGLSGAIAQTVSYPLEVIRRRMQVYGAVDPTTYVGLLQTIRTIWVTNGFKGFFVGLSIGYLKVTPMVAVSFTVYHRMKLLLNID